MLRCRLEDDSPILSCILNFTNHERWISIVTLFQDIFVHHDCFYNYLQCISNFFYVDSSSVHPSHANDDIYLHFMIFDLDVVSSWLCNKLASGLSSIEIVHCTELTRRPNHLAHFES